MMTSSRNALEDATEAVADEEEERLSALGEDRLRPARARFISQILIQMQHFGYNNYNSGL